MFNRSWLLAELVTEFVAELDDGKTDHSRVETEIALDFGLYGGGGIELHDEVVAHVVLRLMFGGWPREVELAPVGDSADDAFVAQDLKAGVAADT